MKKMRYLIVALVASMVLLGVGYAAWTDTLFVNGTVATGDLEVKWVNNGTQRPDNLPVWANWLPTFLHSTYAEANVTVVDDKTIEVELTDLHPGGWALFAMGAQNTGTIPAKFKDAKFEWVSDEDCVNDTQEVKDSLRYLGGFISTDGLGWIGEPHLITTPILGIPYGVKPENWNNLASMGTDVKAALRDIKLDPNGWIVFDMPNETGVVIDEEEDVNPVHCFIIYMDKDADNDTQGATLKFRLTLEWQQ